MSTQINARSPFYIEAEAPTISLGAFTCDVASLTNFTVASDGTITEPNALRGTIIDRDTTSFAANTSGSAISRSVDYTILIPSEYSNADDGTIVCTQTVDQPTQSASEDSAQNDNCPTFSGTIPAQTGVTSTGTAVTLNTYFSEGSGATISRYEAVNYGDAAVTAEFSGTGVNQTVTFKSSNDCAEATFKIIAHNSDDACTASSNTFTVSASCTKSLTCSTDDATNDAINLVGGSIAADGTITRPSYSIGRFKRIEDSSDTDVTDGYSSNTTGSARDVTLTFVFDIPDGYTNSGEIECDKTFSQPPTSAAAPSVACGDDIIRYENIRIANTGDIVTGEAKVFVGSTEATFTVNTKGLTAGNAFPIVYVDTSRDIGVAITVPSGYSNAGNTINCTITRTQPALYGVCTGVEAQGTYYLTAGVANPNGHCGRVYPAKKAVNGTINLGQQVCDSGVAFNGRNLWYGASSSLSNAYAGDVGTSYRVVQIDEFGLIIDMAKANCESGLPDDAIL